MANTTISEFIKEGKVLRVYDGMISVWPYFKEEKKLVGIQEIATKFNTCYAWNNSTLSFSFNNEVYVAPISRSLLKALRKENFKECSFYVPFSNGEFPKKEVFLWKKLRCDSESEMKENFTEDCMAYCDKRHIGKLSDEILQKSFEIPEKGIKVKTPNYEAIYYPEMDQTYLDYRCERLGKYNCNNGKIVFVYRDGKTYVTKGGSKIVEKLEAAGFERTNLFVPFSNLEEIQDPILKAQWDSI